ncbi:MAG: hypothetical protein QXM75_02835 [Candidatus Diapherotrites archaeon]
MNNRAQVATDYLILLSFVISLSIAIATLIVYITNLCLGFEKEAAEIRRRLLQGGN